MYLFEIKNFIEAKFKQNNVIVVPADFLPEKISKPFYAVVNCSPSAHPGSHWISLCILKSGICYYFDSFGFAPISSDIQKFIKINSVKMEFNTHQLQQNHSKTCGFWACVSLFYLANGVSLRDFVRQFGNNLTINDLTIEKMYRQLSY